MLDKVHPVIRSPLYVFAFALIISIVAILVSETYRDDAFDMQQSESRAMRIWKNKIDGSRESNKIIDEYEKSYTQLVKDSIVGEENRLSWFETIQATTNARGMPSVKYSVSSQDKLDDTSGAHKQMGINVYRSKMTLDIKMSHEGDLFAMLNNLDEKAKGLFSVDSCSIEQLSSERISAKESMHAYCELSWYTFTSAENMEKG